MISMSALFLVFLPEIDMNFPLFLDFDLDLGFDFDLPFF